MIYGKENMAEKKSAKRKVASWEERKQRAKDKVAKMERQELNRELRKIWYGGISKKKGELNKNSDLDIQSKVDEFYDWLSQYATPEMPDDETDLEEE